MQTEALTLDDIVDMAQAASACCEAMEALNRVGGNRRALQDVLLSFHRRFEGSEAEIEEAWQRGDRQEARELAHRIKGVAGNISATDRTNPITSTTSVGSVT